MSRYVRPVAGPQLAPGLAKLPVSKEPQRLL